MNDNKYNGWTNYATWRVNLEILGDMDWYETEHVDTDYLKQLVEDIVFNDEDERKQDLLKDSYANAFLSEVNYHEILEHILNEKEIENEDANI